MSRLRRFVEDREPIEIPEIDGWQYLIGYLNEVGPTMAGAMGECPLTHGELRDWQENIGLSLAPWEVRILHRLSFDHLLQAQQSKKPECPPPFGSFIHRELVARKIDEMFT